jgi:hypothetical protein
MRTLAACTIAASLTLAGCATFARSTAEYSTDVRGALADRTPSVTSCYGRALQTMPTAAGTVTVTFRILPESGKVAHAKIRPARSTAPQPVQQCVLDALEEITLDPPDVSEAVVEASWKFTPQKG